MKLLFFQTVKSKVIISLFETVRLSVSISLRNLYNSLNSIKERCYVAYANKANRATCEHTEALTSYKIHLLGS